MKMAFKHVIMFICLCSLVVLPSIHASKRNFTTLSDDYTEGPKEITPQDNVVVVYTESLRKQLTGSVYYYKRKNAQEIEIERNKQMQEMDEKLAGCKAEIRTDIIPAKNSDQNPGRILFSEIDISPVTLIPDTNATVIFKAVRGELIPNDSVAVDMTLTWESLVCNEGRRSEYLLCHHTNKPCPVTANDPFSAIFLLPIPRDLFTAELRIELRNISNGFILGGATLELKGGLLARN